MSEPHNPDAPGPAEGDPAVDEETDPVLAGAGRRLREGSAPLSAQAIEVAALRRRGRRLGLAAAASLVVAVLLGALLVRDGSSGGEDRVSGHSAGVDRIVGSLDAQPVNPTRVKLVSSLSSFADCDALIDDLRRVGAAHVGSRGFGSSEQFVPVGAALQSRSSSEDQAAQFAPYQAPAATDGTTLGTNVQVAGVDELDFVKAEGRYVYDLDGRGNLRITDATTLRVVSTVDVTPAAPKGSDGQVSVAQLLVSKGRVAVFGSETEASAPLAGDPSATRATTSYLTITFVDATDPAKAAVTDRVRVEGSLVSARLVDGQVRLVTTSNMADLGFVLPTTPTSVAKALDRNRRSVAASGAADWIPDWQRSGGKPEPLVPCTRVYVPDTFAGVAMTSMVGFPIDSGRFEPAATSILAPGDTLYAGLSKVVVSSQVWVDPVDRQRLRFDDWRTAVHEFTFASGAAPTYEGSGIVDGSTVGQFAFGEIGDDVAVVTTKGTPWGQQPSASVDLTVLRRQGRGKLVQASKVADLAQGTGAVGAVRYMPDRVLVSTGLLGRDLDVIDVSDPASPRRAGSLALGSVAGYFHPLPDHRALVVGARFDTVGQGRNQQSRNWVQAQLLDVSDADAPRIVSTWERPWSTDQVAGGDHHAFTYWPERKLAMWGIVDTVQTPSADPGPNHAAVLGIDGAVTEVAVPVANEPAEAPAPCPVVSVTDPSARSMLGPDGIALRCADKAKADLDWPRYVCSRVDDDMVARYVPTEQRDAAFFACRPAPPPTVARVLVVSGRPLLLTDQTLEALDPATFRSTAVAYHPTSPGYLVR